VWKTWSILFHFWYFKKFYFIWNLYFYVGSEVLTAITMNISVSWEITPCTPVKFDWSFGGTYGLHLACLTIRLCRWRRYVTPKCQLPFTGLHCVITQKTQPFSILFVSLQSNSIFVFALSMLLCAQRYLTSMNMLCRIFKEENYTDNLWQSVHECYNLMKSYYLIWRPK
jgi:hypothetical protein